MSRTSKLFDDNVIYNAEKALQKLGKYGYAGRKLLAVIAASKHGITAVAKIYGISRTTLTNWVSYVRDLRFDKLEAPRERRKKTRLDPQQMEVVKGWITSNPDITIREVKIRIEDTWAIPFSMAGVHRMMKSFSLSYITPHPRHHRQDKGLVEKFKKKSAEAFKEISGP